VRRLGLIQLKGKSTPTVVYEVLAEKNAPGEAKFPVETIGRYETAFDDFLARRFAQAEAGFQRCEEECPGDFCVETYLRASRAYAAAPPPADWDGRMIMESK
jgi:adenylate cyclase